jgi:hypothetical protein
MRSVMPLSFIPVVCRGLLFLNLVLGSVAAIGQETSTLPDAPQPSQTQSGQSVLPQEAQRNQLSKNHIFWIVPQLSLGRKPGGNQTVDAEREDEGCTGRLF